MTKQELAEAQASRLIKESRDGRCFETLSSHLLALDADIEAGADLSKYRLVEEDPFLLEARKRAAAPWTDPGTQNAILGGRWDSGNYVQRELAALRRGAEMAKELGL